jgi:hypothetical protein
MPLVDPRDIGREQAYGYSPSGPGPYAPQVRRLPPDLQPYQGSPIQQQLQNSLAYSSGLPRYHTIGDPSSGLRGVRYRNPLNTSPSSPWYDKQEPPLGNLLRTIQTTDPGAGYGMSPSGPTARLGSAQFPDTPRESPREGTWMHGNVQRPKGQGVIEQFSVPANYGQSPSNPNWQPRTPKPMSPFYEPPRPPTGGP